MGAGPSSPSLEHAEKLLSGLDAACAEAARLISEADVLLLCTGAGFSADSGLAVYADVAKVKAYACRGLQYHDICQPRWLHSDPELFWGFWGQCYNDYRDTAPHVGYEIINRWVEDRFRHSATAKSIRGWLEEKKKAASVEGEEASHGVEMLLDEEAPATGTLGPYEVTDCAGAFFVFTSNVDAHHFDWFRACEIRECHGNTELYQCAEFGDHCQPVWRIPLDFRFQIDKDTMLAPAAAAGPSPEAPPPEAPAAAEPAQGEEEEKEPIAAAAPAAQPEATPEPAPEAAPAEAPAPAKAPAQAEEEAGSPAKAEAAAEGAAGGSETEASKEEPVARVGRVLGTQRATTLRNMPEAPPWTSFRGFRSNHPICPFCGGKARPAILMFGDMEWQDVNAQARRWTQWRKAVHAHAEDLEDKRLDPPRAVILEIGAGSNVTTVRNTSEQQLRALLHCRTVAHLVRVNPEYPLGDEEDFCPDGDAGERVVSVMSRGLDAVQRMELAMDAIRKKRAREEAEEAERAAREAQPGPEEGQERAEG